LDVLLPQAVAGLLLGEGSSGGERNAARENRIF
jgi:hypothetical protein